MFSRLPRFAAALLSAVALILAGAVTASASSSTSPTTITGPITALGGSWFTLQTAGRRVGVINALTSAATTITNENTPYVWGGGHAEAGVASSGEKGPGHAEAGVASSGEKGPGHNAKRTGYDCSGAVAAVLAAAGLWPAGAGVPADNGVISELLSEHLIARGAGSAPDAVTLYDDPGVHIFMNIDGHFFGTSDGAGGGDKAGGAGWLDDGARDAGSHAYKKYHFLPAVLAQQTSYGNDFTFQLPSSGLFAAYSGSGFATSLGELNVSDLLVGERISVAYATNGTGEMVVKSIAVISGAPTLTTPTTLPTSTATPTTPTTIPTTTTTSTPTVTVPGSPVTVPAPVTPPSSSGAGSGAAGSANGGSGYGYGSSFTGGSPVG